MLRRGLTLLAGLLAAFEAGAAGLSVTPISLEFTTAPVQALWLSNTGAEPLNAQLRAYTWTQSDGADRLEPTRDLLLSPPMMALQPGQRQLIRVIRSASAAAGERSYRILVDELPDPARQQQGLNFVMQFSIPVFAGAPAEAAPALEWRLLSEAGKPVLVADNRGDGRAKITDLELLDAEGRSLLRRSGLFGYVLAGASRRWPLTAQETAGLPATDIQARINGENVRQKLRPRADAR